MNGRVTRVLLAVIALLLAAHVARTVAAAGDDEPAAVLRARTIELVDGDGRVRASLKTEPSGEVVLRMMDPEGDIRVKLGASDDGSGLLLTDDRSEPGVHALAEREGTSLMLAERGKERRVLEP
jgi:hypothetical protein